MSLISKTDLQKKCHLVFHVYRFVKDDPALTQVVRELRADDVRSVYSTVAEMLISAIQCRKSPTAVFETVLKERHDKSNAA